MAEQVIPVAKTWEDLANEAEAFLTGAPADGIYNLGGEPEQGVFYQGKTKYVYNPVSATVPGSFTETTIGAF